MPNKFQKSVLERRGQASISQAATSAANLEPKSQSEPETGAAPQTPTPLGIDSFLRTQTRRKAGSKTFYLDSDVAEALKAAARKRGVAESKLVNDVLRGVLGL